jgi:hypothetical protein
MKLTLRMERTGNSAYSRKPVITGLKVPEASAAAEGATLQDAAPEKARVRREQEAEFRARFPLKVLEFDAAKTVGELRLAIAGVLGVDAKYALFCREDGAAIGRVWSGSVREPPKPVPTFAMGDDPDARKVGAVLKDGDVVEVEPRTGMMFL